MLKWFKEHPDDDILTGPASVKTACKIKDSDSAPIIGNRILLFQMYVGNAKAMQAPLYGLPVSKFKSEAVAYQPQILLKFVAYDSEDEPNHEKGILDTQISFRLKWSESEVTESRIKSVANNIYSIFATPLYKWKKGVEIFSYRDIKNGYELRIYCYSQAEGEQVCKQVLKIQNHTFNPDFVNESKSRKSFPANPGTRFVLGETKKKIRQRPIGTVRFHYAQFDWAELSEPILLVGAPYIGGDPVVLI
ncbi:hypothetical protein [Argonema antarcticum]|uniref:hypothetical protein n=1 Tax=Argonema antarcticum TaxID=2942763 RepID=UPI0020127397|nr:hypothetical protein [Argonema antarcticum]MCL1474420.1 hypothetical protein [Argonema antarcticum A004/B2]